MSLIKWIYLIFFFAFCSSELIWKSSIATSITSKSLAKHCEDDTAMRKEVRQWGETVIGHSHTSCLLSVFRVLYANSSSFAIMNSRKTNTHVCVRSIQTHDQHTSLDHLNTDWLWTMTLATFLWAEKMIYRLEFATWSNWKRFVNHWIELTSADIQLANAESYETDKKILFSLVNDLLSFTKCQEKETKKIQCGKKWIERSSELIFFFIISANCQRLARAWVTR